MYQTKSRGFRGLGRLYAVLLAVIGLSVIFSGDVAAYRSAAEIDNYLPGGRDTITSIENGLASAYIGCNTNRTCLNNSGGAYWYSYWISPAGTPNAGSQLTLPSSTRNVPLQLNSFFFLSAATAARNVDSNVGVGTLSTTNTYPNRVNTGNYPNDRRPASSPTINVASLKAQRAKVYSARVSSGGGSLSNVATGSVIGTSTDPNSRYALGSPMPFTYNSGTWTGLRRTVTIEFTIAVINTFHSAPPGGTSQCTNSSGRLITISSNSFDSCGTQNVYYTFDFFVIPVWNLEPEISLNGKQSAVSGERITVAPSVNNIAEGPSTGTRWAVSSMVYPPGPSPNTTKSVSSNGGATANMSVPCQHFTSRGGTSCRTVGSGTGNYPPGTTPLTALDDTIADHPLGTRICYALSVFSKDNMDINPANRNWAHSALACLTIGKKPMAQVLGGDLWVGRASVDADIVTGVSTVRRNGNRSSTYGSYTEYAIASTGVVTGMASGSGYAGGASTNVLCSLSLLTFNNAQAGTCSNESIGGYNKLPSAAPQIASRFPVSSSSPSVSGTVQLANLTSRVYRAGNNGTITIPAATIQRGRWVVINAPGNTVRITGNIQYANAVLSRLRDIPQVVIIANNILIDESVSRVDAWLVAAGTGANGIVNTCSASNLDNASPAQLETRLHAGRCDDRLTVNGPVIANRLLLRRTAGAGPGNQAGNPAEVFNFRPDAYLWLVERSAASRAVPTVHVRELPPRY